MNWNTKVFYVDGGCRGNHAQGNRQAYGSISDGKSVERLEFPQATTNNEAEYLALLHLLKKLTVGGPCGTAATIYMDSKLVVGQLTGGYKVNAKNLRPLWDEARSLVAYTGAKLVWVPRPEIVKWLGH